MGNDFTTAQELYASTAVGGPVTTDFHIFASFYTAIFTPLDAGVQGVLAALLPWMLAAVTAGTGATLMLWALAVALGHENVGMALNRMIPRVLLPAAVVVFLLSSVGTYQNWVVTWVEQIPDDIGRIATGGMGGEIVNSGDPFDSVLNKANIAGAKVFDNIPWSLKGVVLALIVIAYWFAAAAASLISFAMFIASRALFKLLIATSAVFIGVGAFQQSRFLLKGFVSAVASVISAQILIEVLLGMTFIIENKMLAPILAAPDNANVAGLVFSLIQTAIVLAICAVLATKIPAVAVGIAGGVFDGFGAWIAGGQRAMSALATAARGAASYNQIGSGTAPQPVAQAAGRSLSGRP